MSRTLARVFGGWRTAELTGLPIKNVADLTTARGGYWFACLPSDGTPPEVLRDQLLKVYG